ncbi:NmrA family NAD(P)-binding protein [Actinoalloteichus hymeniacidonis]|uniref:NmrA-like domain-containing protein n=1 Tax=Actinoalloteichus hymeniacidonis TaxID=340345 RepID=A0AAC9N034_9PSEU|nr:NAD(P)H-binding protein [Actinoalloteichus hymeniacidonis]AOS64995.1 hypothetical protein TL08_21020 [Actinoalloteichus hymeniacidonis]MBB5906929.1 uncharacterized protein YbjT (DUF2867 family) [Actinoalloteichus hymeniacidonis]
MTPSNTEAGQRYRSADHSDQSIQASASALVIGGTGTTGSRVVAQLRAEGAAYRLATRSPSADDSAHVAFDWFAPETHLPALAGVDRVYLIAPVGVANPIPVLEPFLHAAREAGVRRVVLLSSSAVTEDTPVLGQAHRLVRELLPEWAILRPSWFMQNFIDAGHPIAEGLRTRGEIVTAAGTGRVPFVDAADIAAVAVRSLLDVDPPNVERVITGPEALSYDQAVAIIAEVTGRPVAHRSVEDDAFVAHLVANGIPAEFAAVLGRLDQGIRQGSEDRTTSVVVEVTGRQPGSFREFVTANRAAFPG